MANYGTLSTEIKDRDTFTIDGVAYPMARNEELSLEASAALARYAFFVETFEGAVDERDIAVRLAAHSHEKHQALREDLTLLTREILPTLPDEVDDKLKDGGRQTIAAAFLTVSGARTPAPAQKPTPIRPTGARSSRVARGSTAATRRAGNG